MWDGLADIARIFQISPCGKLVLLIEVTVEIDGLPFHKPWRCFNIEFHPGSFVLSDFASWQYTMMNMKTRVERRCWTRPGASRLALWNESWT